MKVITISSQTPVVTESRLKSILLNRVIERLEYPKNVEKLPKKAWENVEKHRFDEVKFRIRLKTLGPDVAKFTTKITKFAS